MMNYTVRFVICRQILLHCGQCTRRIKINEAHYVTNYGVPYCQEHGEALIASGIKCDGVEV